ncbi:phosphatidylserine decarboxylase proenzyme [mine drainage metagenome]|uniref:Phosphatidylserine decarboxylase proenzyme n=1 Tax=mine drainage metagenome TaxID=410659 RepID=A0A1J5QH34_9ZZZZ
MPGLFARNERVVCVFEGMGLARGLGQFVLVLVGATIVGSMATVWHGVVNASRVGQMCDFHYENKSIELKQGEEMGRFLLGSTVVVVWPSGPLQFNASWQPDQAVRLGQAMALGVCPSHPDASGPV